MITCNVQERVRALSKLWLHVMYKKELEPLVSYEYM